MATKPTNGMNMSYRLTHMTPANQPQLFTKLCVGIIGLVASISVAQAEPGFAKQYKSQFGYMPSCNACHVDGGGSPLNAYGKAFEKAGGNAAAFALIAAQDSDGDGASNADEGAAKSDPGDAASTPDKPGNWLSTENLIPKPVQQAFPEVKTYKPLDALFTDSDIERAKGMGVSLSKADETVIYLTVAGGKPVCMAIIVPVDGEWAFALVATTRKLAVDQVVPINADDIDFGDLNRFKGQFAPKVEGAVGASTAVDQLAYAVKKAGAMIYVRLKKK